MPLIGEIAALVTAALWAGSSIVFTEAARRMGSQMININRMIVAGILLFITILIAGWNIFIPEKDIFLLVISGLIGLVFGDGFLFKAFQKIGARFSMLIMSLVPAMSAILAYVFLGERLSLTVLFGMAVTLAGITFVVSEGKPNAKERLTLIGVVFALFGALGQAGGLLFAKAAFSHGEINGFVAAFIRIGSSALLYLPVMLIMKSYINPVKLYRHDTKSLYLTFAGGIFGPYFGMTLSLVAIKYTDVGIASTLMATVPVLMLPLLRIIYKEKITIRGIVGTIIAVAGVAILFLH